MLLLLQLGATLALDLQQHGNKGDWYYQYTKSDSPPDYHGPNNDARGQPSASVIAAQTGHEGSRHTERQNAESVEILHDDSFRGHISHSNQPVKMARFVADPSLFHLIEDVNEEEQQRLRETTTGIPEAIERVTKTSAVETVTVHYEATKVNPLTYLWNEFINLGDLLGREVYDTISARLSFVWRSFVKLLKSRRRRALTDTSI